VTLSSITLAPRFGLAYRFTDKFVLRGVRHQLRAISQQQYAWNYPVRQANGTNQTTSLSLPQWPSGQICFHEFWISGTSPGGTAE